MRSHDQARPEQSRRGTRGRGENKLASETGGAGLRELGPDELYWRCDTSDWKFATTDDIKLAQTIVGQQRAVNALMLGLEINSVGYNVFVSGPVGTGRTTTVRQLLESTRTRPVELDDKLYVANFRDPDSPCLLRLRPGAGRRFKQTMDEFIEYLVKSVPLAYESEAYQRQRQEVIDGFKERGGARVREFEKKIAAAGFALVQTAPFLRPDLAPIVDKQPVRIDDLPRLVEEGKLTAERAAEIRAAYAELSSELGVIFKEIREYEKLARETLVGLDREAIQPLLDERIGDITEKFDPECAPSKPGCVRAWLGDVRNAVLERLELFRQKPADQPANVDPYLEFRVNVLVDNAGADRVPVIFETNPSYKNIFGWIDRVWDRAGQWRVDFTRIKAGSLLRADGGFLVINAIDALLEPGVWPTLKRTLRNRQLDIAAQDSYSLLFGSATLKPEPVPINVKVIMIGDPEVYALLSAYDEDFRKIFKVRADFDWEMAQNAAAVAEYTQVIKSLGVKEGLRPLDRSGVQAVVEYGARLAGRQDKLSTRFNIINEVLMEADYWAGKAKAKTTTAEHVRQAIAARRERARLIEEKLQEAIDQGQIFIDTTGARVGQVNGLAVYATGEYAFGKPARITAKTGVGSAGIINIEREAQLSGPTHDKGVFILTGYLRQKYARRQPLVLSASICFEQSYGQIDGDSASSTEVYALLSDLAGLPLRQDIAVTGSVNQQGEIQPIGGVNQKIEGFFATCQARGLTGTQGVMIPEANRRDLVLREEVVEAVRQGKFHIWTVRTIDDGIELLTGKPAGKPDARGNYPPDSVNGLVQRRLAELARLYHQAEEKRKANNRRRPTKPRPPERRVRRWAR